MTPVKCYWAAPVTKRNSLGAMHSVLSGIDLAVDRGAVENEVPYLT